jgi:hypothetical protein
VIPSVVNSLINAFGTPSSAKDGVVVIGMPFGHEVCGIVDHRVARLSTFVARLPEGKIDRRETYVLGCTEHPS